MKTFRFIFYISVVTAIIVGCMKPPNVPVFDTTFKLPLIDKNYYIYELEDSTEFIIEHYENGDSIFYIQDGNINSSGVDSLMFIKSHQELYNWIPLYSNTQNNGSLGLDESDFSDERITVSYGKVKSWALHFEVRDPDPQLTSIFIVFHSVFDPDGNPLQVEITDFSDTTFVSLDANEAADKYYTIGAEDSDVLLDSLQFSVTPQIDIQNTEKVCEMRVSYENSICFTELKGNVFNRNLPIESDIEDFELNYPENADSTFVISEARMFFTITNELGFKVGFCGKLTGFNDQGESRAICIDQEDNLIFDEAISPEEPVTSTQVLSDSLDYLLNIFPSRIELTGAYFVVGQTEYETGFISTGQKASGNYKGKVPFLFAINEGLIRNDSTFVTELSDEVRGQIRDYAHSAKIKLKVVNTMPAAAHAYLHFSTINNPDTLYHYPDSVYSKWNLLIPREEENTYTPPNTTEEFVFDLSEEDIHFFTQKKYYLGIELLMESTDGETIYIAPEDFLGIDGDLDIVLHFGD